MTVYTVCQNLIIVTYQGKVDKGDKMRKLILILVLTCLTAWILPQVSVAEIDPETAVGVWLLDEGVGKTTKDSSGKDHDGTINGAKWKDGKFGKALEFDGGQWVTIESTPELQVGEELTMMAWFFATDIGDWRQLIAKSNEYLLRIDPPQEGNKMSAFVKPAAVGNREPLQMCLMKTRGSILRRLTTATQKMSSLLCT